jgi:hypothetical protein
MSRTQLMQTSVQMQSLLAPSIKSLVISLQHTPASGSRFDQLHTGIRASNLTLVDSPADGDHKKQLCKSLDAISASPQFSRVESLHLKVNRGWEPMGLQKLGMIISKV